MSKTLDLLLLTPTFFLYKLGESLGDLIATSIFESSRQIANQSGAYMPYVNTSFEKLLPSTQNIVSEVIAWVFVGLYLSAYGVYLYRKYIRN